MAARRGNSEGTFRQRADGRWEGQLRYTDSRGKSHRVSAYGPTRKTAKDALDEKLERIRGGLAVVDSKSPLAEVARRWRTTTLVSSDRADTTKETYATRCQGYIETGMLAEIPLSRLTPSDVEAWIVEAKENEAVSDSSLRQDFTILRAVLDTAVRDGLVARNVAAVVSRPRLERKEAIHLSPAQVKQLIDKLAGSRHFLPIFLASRTGMRRGEVMALRWRDVDLVAGKITVTGSLTRTNGKLRRSPMTKTKTSHRSILLTDRMVEMLRDRQTEQFAQRKLASNLWQNDEIGYVFTTDLGGPIDPRNVLRTVQTAAEKLDLPKGTGMHTLRHSAATAWLGYGTHIKLVSAILGHNDIGITGDIYGHTPDDAQRAAMDALDTMFDSPRGLFAIPSDPVDKKKSKKNKKKLG